MVFTGLWVAASLLNYSRLLNILAVLNSAVVWTVSFPIGVKENGMNISARYSLIY